MTYQFPTCEYFGRGHTACPGCGETITRRQTLKGLGGRTILVVPAGCAAVVDGMFPHSASGVPLLHVPFETTAAAAAGVKNGLLARGDEETVVVGYAGDGGTFDIGFQALSSIAERNEDIIYVCYDNEAYMNTGIQRSSATPRGAWTNTTPSDNPKSVEKKDIMAVMAAHHIPYAASASIAFPEDYMEKLKKAKAMKGFRFFHVLSPCPTGWRTAPDLTIHLARLAVTTGLFPLLEIFEGKRYVINVEPARTGVEEYLGLQGRFGHLKETEVAMIKKEIEEKWLELSRLGAA